MEKPDPVPGLVIRCGFVWKGQTNQDYGKQRPCAIVLANRTHPKTGKTTQIICPITHTPPDADERAVALSAKECRALGLDGAGQWIKTHEVNEISWDDPELEKATPDQWAYGRLSKATYEQTRTGVLEHHRERRLALNDRTQEGEQSY